MERSTRTLIQQTTQAARRLLEREFSQQLEGTYDMLPTGTVKPEPGGHLDAGQVLVRQKLVAAFEHHRSVGLHAQEAVAALLREIAFKTLNRFVALKMLEARELVQECLSRGEQSAGFREFSGLAGGLATLPDRGYRLYLECLFDEIGREVRVLFDRRDVASLLWPRRQALHELLELLNDPALMPTWREDETIGWVYQFFNGEDERRTMRDESQAPRNSRELAVRNQFFTPRYVVEFLVDNTLGRIWYEMRQGNTRLADQCVYLVRPSSDNLERPEMKDPRTLRILDPAAGSGHFLLYCFDLLLAIYEETWDICPEHLGDLYAAYDEKADFLKQVPGLILAHNLHGIEIDPRAAQIAELALWMRAQRAYADLGIPRAERTPIKKTNIVVAEPMPGERRMLTEFLRTVDERLRLLIEKIWQEMEQAGEAGSLLQIERAIDEELRKTLAQRFLPPPARQVTLFATDQPPEQSIIEFAPTDDPQSWAGIEEDLVDALKLYAEQASGATGLRRRLFAENAAHGFAFVDLCRQRFDVVLMNPPFGAASKPARVYIERTYPRTKNDLYAAFVERGLHMLQPGGMLGAITSRTGFFLSSFQKWREEILLREAQPVVFADLGYGVLDTAMVETAAYCLRRADGIMHGENKATKADGRGGS